MARERRARVQMTVDLLSTKRALKVEEVRAGLTILLVEDHDEVCEITVDLLREFGHQVFAIPNADQRCYLSCGAPNQGYASRRYRPRASYTL